MDFEKKRLSDTEALGIANDLLKAFSLLYNAVPMKLTTSIEGGRKVITRVFYDSDNKKVRLEEGIFAYKDYDGYHLDNVYELYWKKCKFKVTLYSSAEECGYYSLFQDCKDLAYVFCIIEEINQKGSIENEMYFAFDSEKKTFLELFDIEHHFLALTFNAEDSIEEKLRGRVIC